MLKIMTDSACDLSDTILADLGITVVPLMVLDQENEYLDGQNIKPKDVFDAMREGKVFKTSQVPLEFFSNVFNALQDDDEVLYIAFSSGLSGTYNTGLLARDNYLEEGGKAHIEILDTLAASGGFGLIVYQVAIKAKTGVSLSELVAYAKNLIMRIDHIFTVDDLEYLFRGGRVTRSAALIGGLLNIKPILTVLDGKLTPLEKVRGRLKSIKRMCELMGERSNYEALEDQTIFINHGDDLDAAYKLKGFIEEAYGCKSFVIHTVGSAVGAHSGPGTLALFYFKPLD